MRPPRWRRESARRPRIWSGSRRRSFSCHVTIEAPHRHQRQGRQYRARMDVLDSTGSEIVVTKENPRNQTHEDPMVAIRDAFEAAVRQVEDHVHKRNGQVKHHEPTQPD